MIATVASYTSANRIKRSLSFMDIYSTVIQTPHTLTSDGCGYSLRFEDEHNQAVKKAANDLGINIRAFYTEKNVDGQKNYIKFKE